MTGVYPLKCRIRAETGATRVDVYDDIGEGGWFGEGLTAKSFSAQLSAISGALDVHINSAGGDVFDGIAIASALRGYKGRVTTTVDGLAASIASVIAQAGQDRVVASGSMVMIHDAFGVCVGNAGEMAKMSGTLDQVSDNIAGIYASRSGGDVAVWRAAMKDETWYTAGEAVAAGLADKVGAGAAQLPAGLDLAAFTALPGRIAARLREMPAAARPQAALHPFDGAHNHAHAAYGDSTADDDGQHSHPHGHADDGDHGHSHAPDAAAAHAPARPAAAASEPYVGVTQARHEPMTGAHSHDHAAMGAADHDDGMHLHSHAHAGDALHDHHTATDPDGDGDDDSTPAGDADHDYWTAGGTRLQPLPGAALTADGIRGIVREELAAYRAAGADESAWDGPAAMSAAAKASDPAAALSAICAGERDGDPKTQAAHALPHHRHPGDPPNRNGVTAALGRLDGTGGLTNKQAAESHLKAHQSAMGAADDSTDTDLSGIDLGELRAALKGATA